MQEQQRQPLSKYILEGKIEHKEQEDIYRAFIYGTNEKVIVKKIKSNNQNGISIIAIRETSMLKSITHNNIVKLIDVEYIQGNIRLIMEYFDQDLQQYLNNYIGYLPNLQVKKFMYDILRGIQACHMIRCMHRNLKSSSILISKEGILKITDFGMSRIFNGTNHFTFEVSTLWYKAPELLIGNQYYTYLIDLWAIGCIFIEIILKQPPFQGENELQQLKLIIPKLTTLFINQQKQNINNNNKLLIDPDVQNDLNKQLHLKLLNKIDKDGLNLIQKLLTINPQSRINCYNALNHPYFDQIKQQ